MAELALREFNILLTQVQKVQPKGQQSNALWLEGMPSSWDAFEGHLMECGPIRGICNPSHLKRALIVYEMEKSAQMAYEKIVHGDWGMSLKVGTLCCSVKR